jgi:rare lipoprotein A
MQILNLRFLLLSCCLIGLLLVTIYPAPLRAEENSTAGAIQETAAQQKGVDALAAYYSKRYKGRHTSSGHRYNPAGLTAAHPSLPLGSRVKVINLANNKEVIVTVNDRCRARKQPFIDLSREAAKQLGFLGKGNARVRLITLTGQSS